MHRHANTQAHTYAALSTVLHVRETITDISNREDVILKGTHPSYCKAPNFLV